MVSIEKMGFGIIFCEEFTWNEIYKDYAMVSGRNLFDQLLKNKEKYRQLYSFGGSSWIFHDSELTVVDSMKEYALDADLRAVQQ